MNRIGRTTAPYRFVMPKYVLKNALIRLDVDGDIFFFFYEVGEILVF